MAQDNPNTIITYYTINHHTNENIIIPYQIPFLYENELSSNNLEHKDFYTKEVNQMRLDTFEYKNTLPLKSPRPNPNHTFDFKNTINKLDKQFNLKKNKLWSCEILLEWLKVKGINLPINYILFFKENDINGEKVIDLIKSLKNRGSIQLIQLGLKNNKINNLLYKYLRTLIKNRSNKNTHLI